MNESNSISAAAFDRHGLALEGPYLERSRDGMMMIRCDVYRQSDGARMELAYARYDGDGPSGEYCRAETRQGWAVYPYDDCLFYADRRTWEGEIPPSGHDRTRWTMSWLSADHPDILPTTWPGHFHSARNVPVEELFLLLIHEIDKGITRVESALRELEGPSP